MLTGEIEETYETPTDESPTFGVVDDGRTYPAVTARRRQQQGSKRETLYTVSKHGKYAHLYDDFRANIIDPYRERKRKRAAGGGDTRVNSANTYQGGHGAENAPRERAGTFGFPVRPVDG